MFGDFLYKQLGVRVDNGVDEAFVFQYPLNLQPLHLHYLFEISMVMHSKVIFTALSSFRSTHIIKSLHSNR